MNSNGAAVAASAGGNKVIYTVTLNPALDKTVEIPDFTLDAVNRITTLRTDPGGKGLNVSKVIQKLGGKMCIRDRCQYEPIPFFSSVQKVMRLFPA